jgi:hypothetical protein
VQSQDNRTIAASEVGSKGVKVYFTLGKQKPRAYCWEWRHCSPEGCSGIAMVVVLTIFMNLHRATKGRKDVKVVPLQQDSRRQRQATTKRASETEELVLCLHAMNPCGTKSCSHQSRVVTKRRMETQEGRKHRDSRNQRNTPKRKASPTSQTSTMPHATTTLDTHQSATQHTGLCAQHGQVMSWYGAT